MRHSQNIQLVSVMRTPHAHLTSITHRLGYAKRYSDYKMLMDYVVSQDFVTSYNALGRPDRERVWKSLYAAQLRCVEAHDRRNGRLITKPTDSNRNKVKWDAANIAKLKRTASDEAAARLFGITLKAAYIARRRYVAVSTTTNCVEAPRKAA